jgi:heptaprenyl diphosphate synthase
VELADAALADDIRGGLARVEDGLQSVISTRHPVLATSATHLMAAGGKRLRPIMVLLAAQFGDPADPRVIQAAIALELTHLATLYHDDVMDEADVRRGTVSANSRWGNSVAILTGDFLFARASALLAELGTDAIRIQAETFGLLVTGQLAETVGCQPGEDPLEHYISVVRHKTASLFATSGRFGAMFSGASPEVVERMTPACLALGVAFQLADDILDVASASEQSGKTPGTDLREGVRTLPMLHALASAGDNDRLAELLRLPHLSDPALHAEALELLRAHPAMELARKDTRQWAEDARAQILGLPDVPARSAFEALCEYVTERTG